MHGKWYVTFTVDILFCEHHWKRNIIDKITLPLSIFKTYWNENNMGNLCSAVSFRGQGRRVIDEIVQFLIYNFPFSFIQVSQYQQYCIKFCHSISVTSLCAQTLYINEQPASVFICLYMIKLCCCEWLDVVNVYKHWRGVKLALVRQHTEREESHSLGSGYLTNSRFRKDSESEVVLGAQLTLALILTWTRFRNSNPNHNRLCARYCLPPKLKEFQWGVTLCYV